MTRIQAVFTGDLIGSRDASAEAVERSMAALNNAAQALGKSYEFDPRFTRYRGDGWQILLPKPRFTLVTYLAMTASLRAADTGVSTRMAIGLGTVETPGSQNLSDASGAAFVASGDLLEGLSETTGPETAVIGGSGATPWQQGIIDLADWITGGWTAHQAEAVAMVLLDQDHDTNAQRAKALGISRQAFESRLKGSGFSAFFGARRAFQRHDFDGATT